MAAATVPRVSDNPVVQQHYAAQAGLLEVLAQAAEVLGPNLGRDARRALAALTREFQSASISLGADYYDAIRAASDVPGSYRPPVIDPWGETDITAYINSTVSDLMAEAEANAQAVATAQRLTLDSGIDEVFASMKADPKAPRWARVTRPGACSFCLMLATRGATYRTYESANFRAHTRYDGSGGVCRCTVEPSFTAYEPPAHIRAAQALYSEATAGLPRGADRANAFRRALDAQRRASA